MGAAQRTLRMMRLYTVGWRHVLGSRDKSYSLKHRPNPSEGVRVPKDPAKRIVFLRHGESAWNEVFNRGFGPSFPVRLVSAWVRELMGLQDGSSLFLDSPLSATGEEQVSQLRSWLERGGRAEESGAVAGLGQVLQEADEVVRMLRGQRGKGSSVLTCSNLRRAMATAAGALSGRLAETGERIKMLSCTQEISRNLDTISISPPGQAVPIDLSGSRLPATFDASGHVGNKPVRQQGIKRLEAFAEWATAQPEDTIVLGGHSLFFREFFRAYLPTGATEGLAGTARKRKIHNCGVVSFKLHAGGEGAFCIDPDSITPVYLGFS